MERGQSHSDSGRVCCNRVKDCIPPIADYAIAAFNGEMATCEHRGTASTGWLAARSQMASVPFGRAILLTSLLLLFSSPCYASKPGDCAVWQTIPSREALLKVYPETAFRKRIDGRTVISCSVTDEGAMKDCVVVSESPGGYGFGPAALAVNTMFKLRPLACNGEPVVGGRVSIPLRWIAPHP